MKRNRSALLGLAFVVAGLSCLRPEPARADERGAKVALANGEESAPTVALTLTRALELGRQRAPLLRAARAQARAAAAGTDEQRAAYWPSLGAHLGGTGSAVRDTQPGPPPEGGRFSYEDDVVAGSGGLGARWTLTDFGRTRAVVLAAAAAEVAGLARAAAAELEVATEVAHTFVTLHHAQRLRDETEAIVAQRERLAAVARGLVKAALQPPLEELRAAARVEQARLLEANAESELRDARAALALLLALDPEAPFVLAPPRLPLAEPAPVPTPASLVEVDPVIAAQGAEDLPAVVAARADAESGRNAAEAAVARYRPSLSLSADATYSFTRHAKIDLVLSTRAFSAGLTLSVPVWEPGIAPGVRRARAEAEAALARAEQARRQAASEAARAALAVRTTAVAAGHARRAAEDAATVLEIVQARYLRGLSSPLELIEAESTDADARVAQVRAELARDLAIVRLYAATGRTLDELPS